jgi:hypothetical protein
MWLALTRANLHSLQKNGEGSSLTSYRARLLIALALVVCTAGVAHASRSVHTITGGFAVSGDSKPEGWRTVCAGMATG